MSKAARHVKTGLFDIDLDAGLISRQGRRVPLQEQPFRVLEMLLERPGELVSREEIRTCLWPADTYVSFDEGLNTAVRKLRVVFQDSADNPRFIQTVPKRGYRFIAPVAAIEEEPERTQEAVREGGGHSAMGAETRQSPVAPSGLGARRRSLGGWALVAAVALVVVGAIVSVLRMRSHVAVEEHPRNMLVVLPFQNLSGDPAQEYFSDGLTEETITDLGQLSPAHLGVIARTSSMSYKHTDKTVGQIGRELNADFVLEGSVRRENARVRISAQLIRVSDQTHLWAQSYDARNAGDLIDVQNAIGRAIAEQVRIQVAPQYQADGARLRGQNPAAYDLYLQGRFYWNQRTPASLRKSIELFKQATVADPNFAQAYAGLADAYNIANIVGALSSKASSPEAKAAALKALEIDPSLAEAHAALGMEKSHYEFDLSGAKEEFQRAIELNPNSAYAHLFYSGAYLMPMGLRAEAVAEMKKAVELDPLSLPINNFLGQTYLLAGDYEASEVQFRHTIAMNPNFPLSHGYLADLLKLMGKFDEAIREGERSDLLSGVSEKESADRAGRRERAYKSGGAEAFWREQLAQDMRANEVVSSAFVIVAQDYALAGEKEAAFKWLDKSFEEREGGELTLLAVDPMWNNLHGDARFEKLLRQIGLPDPEAISH